MEELATAHNRFEQIHPFLDGNGRTGRLLLNLVLVRLGYAPAIIHKRDRTRYLTALQAADAGDSGPLGEMLARTVLDNLYRFIVPAIASPNRLVPLAALSSSAHTEGSLRVAANRGRLRAQKGADRQWRSTRAWVNDYVESRHKRQPRARVRSTQKRVDEPGPWRSPLPLQPVRTSLGCGRRASLSRRDEMVG